MDLSAIVKTVHIVSAAILFGTAFGITFFMFRSHAADTLRERYFAVRTTVLAENLFVLPTVFILPLTGIWLLHDGSHDPDALWVALAIALFTAGGVCWLPVVWLQVQLRNMLADAVRGSHAVPERYRTLYRVWCLLAWLPFAILIVIFALMVAKPV